MSYCLSLNGYIIHANKIEHKKSGLFTYRGVSPEKNEWCNSVVLFDTVRQAQLWLLQYSSFPSFNTYISSPALTDELLERLYLKGKYSLSKVWLDEKFLVDPNTKPLLCEVIIQEYHG